MNRRKDVWTRAKDYGFRNFKLELAFIGGKEVYISPGLRQFIQAQMSVAWWRGYKAGRRSYHAS
jgi:hypothetical protein